MTPTRHLARFLTCALIAAAGGSLLAAPAGAVTPCPASFGSFSAGHWPTACWRPYGPDSPFNKALPANPTIAPDSGAVINDMQAHGWHFEGGGSKFAFISPGRGAVYYSQPSDPLIKIHCTYHWGQGTCQGADGVSLDGRSIRVPANAKPQNESDQHLTIVDQAADMEYDFEHAEWSPDHSTLIVWAGGETSIGPDSGTGLGVPSTAASFSTIAGLIRAPELQAGSINHALVASIPCTQGAVWPAKGPWGLDCRNLHQGPNGGQVAPRIGSLLQLHMSDAQIAATGAPSWERAIMTAMAHYGVYVNDTSGAGDPNTIELEKESDVTYTAVGGRPEMARTMKSLGASYWAPSDRWILSGLPISLSDLRVVDPCVAHGTCPAGSGSSPSAHAARAASPKRSSEPRRHAQVRAHVGLRIRCTARSRRANGVGHGRPSNRSSCRLATRKHRTPKRQRRR